MLVAALRTGRREHGASLREEILGAASLLGALTVVSTELIGVLHAITPETILGFWLSCTAAAAIALLWRWRRFGPLPPVRAERLDATDGVLVGSIALIALTLLVVAWLSPPPENVMVTGASAGLAERPPFREFRPEVVVVFATDAETLRFQSRIDADGTAMDLLRQHGSAAIYQPAQPTQTAAAGS